LAIEAAIKTAMDYKESSNPIVLSLKESFHGINGYGSFVTDRFDTANQKLQGFPIADWCVELWNPKYVYKDREIDIEATAKRMELFKLDLETACQVHGDDIVALLIEPIQSTYGDNYFPKEWFEEIRVMCNRYDICLIFDEIQTGFGATGKMWYHQHLGIEPDIVAFGKKSQTSGIMVKEKFAKIFETPVRLEATWDGDLIDMVRCNYILKAYDQYHILENVRRRGVELLEGLKKIEQVKNARGTGLIVAFDLDKHEAQEQFAKNAFEYRLLFNKTRDTTIRLRPNLNVSSGEVQEALKIIRKSVSDG
jgi:L-lysine 6-transaminase